MHNASFPPVSQNDLKFICGVYTSWQDYEGEWENRSVDEHLAQYRDQLQRAQALGPEHINAHSGSDSWSREECEQFYSQAVEVCLTVQRGVAREVPKSARDAKLACWRAGTPSLDGVCAL